MPRSFRFGLGALLALMALLLPARPAAAIPPIPPPPFEIGVDESFEGGVTDGFFVVWVDHPTFGDSTFRLQAHSVARHAPLVLSDKLAFAYYHAPLSPSYALSSGKLLWIDTGVAGLDLDPAAKLMLTDLGSGESRQIALGRVIFPGLDGQVATWWEVDDAGNRHLKRHTIGASEEPADLAQLTGSFYGAFSSKMSNHWEVWAVRDTTVGTQQCWSLYALSLDNGGTSRRIDTAGCNSLEAQYDLAGDTLAYVSNDGLLHVLDLTTGQDRTSGPHESVKVSTDGRYVFWSKKDAVWGFDPRSESAFPVRQGSDVDYRLSTRGGALLWRQADRLRLSHVGRLLPTGPQSAIAGRRHFPETNHTLGGEFLAYWSRNGGLPVFGYPLTEEFMQKNASDGKGYTVQYLERQRYELHPENTGTPYIVLLGRLGAEALAAKGVDWESLPKASPGAPHFYPQTGQAIDPLFWDYWRSHGLELGDAGVSEREALALWGYPLSGLTDERLSDGTTIKVQWYERARLEYHPENQPPYNVLLGRLAADTLEGMFK